MVSLDTLETNQCCLQSYKASSVGFFWHGLWVIEEFSVSVTHSKPF